MSQSIYTSHYTYLITNTTNQMKYIGVRSCSCLPENDSDYMGSSKILGEAMKVEPETFTKIIIDTFPAREIANSNEQWLHETYDVARNPLFYNQMNAPLGFDYTGKHHSKETKERLRVSHKGRTITPEHKKKISEAQKGKTISPETRKKLSESHKGKKFTDEHKKKISENYVGFRGKKHSAETRAKMSKSMRGKKKSHRTEEHNRKIGDAQKGISHPKSTCPYCSKTGGNRIMKRWHFTNCKEISTIF
jgi:hypothetical protein